MKDYYKILGVKEEAAEEEIRAHWAELTKRYHPDLGKGGDAEEKLKEINEAYRILKDPSARLEHDLERIFKHQYLDKARRMAEKKKKTRRTMFAIGIALFSIMAGLFIFKWVNVPGPPSSEMLHPINRIDGKETVSTRASAKTEPKVQVLAKVLRVAKQEASSETPAKSVPPLPAFPLTPAEKESKPDEAIQAVKEPPRETPIAVVKKVPPAETEPKPVEKPKEQRVAPPVEPSKPPVKEETLETPIAVVKKVPEEVPVRIPSIPIAPPTPAEVQKEPKRVEKPKEERVAPPVEPSKPPVKEAKEPPVEIPEKVLKETPGQVSQVIPPEKTRVAKPEPAPIPPKPVLPPPFVREEEVNRFFSNYIDRYHQKDIDGFLSLFSRKAIQNRKDGFEEIQKIYTAFFDQSRELRYHLEEMRMEIYQESVEVRARYRVDQILKKRGEEKRWQGPLRSVLIKEDGALKIIALDYQHDRSS